MRFPVIDYDTHPAYAPLRSSTNYDDSFIEDQIRMNRALDRIIGNRYSQTSEDGDYRVLARRPELRRIFMELPAAFRGSSHFGDAILAPRAGHGTDAAPDGTP
jgi:hypothetical protein